MQPQAAQATLKRAVTRWEVVAISLNDVIGSGVYLLPAAIAAGLGSASIWAVPLAGVAVALIVLCFAEAGSRFAEPGGAYLYAREAFGPWVGFQVGWMTWLARVASVAALSVGFAKALGYVLPAANEGAGRYATIVALVAALALLNVRGVEFGARAAAVLAAAKLVPLLVLIAAGLPAITPGLYAASGATGGPGGLREAVLEMLFAYAGFENTAAAAGEYRRPERDVPFALLFQIGLVTVLYSLVQVVAVGVVPNLGAAERPLADAAERLLGSFGGVLLTVGAVVSILGTCSNTMLAAPRYLFAMARDGGLPRFLARVHPTWRSPWVAILAHAIVALPLALSGSFVELALLSVVARLASYLGTALAIPVLRRRAATAARGFTLPGGWSIPVLAALACLALLAAAGLKNALAGGIALVIGSIVYRVSRPRR